MEEKARIIQELVPGKQVTIAHLIAHPDEDLAKKMGVPGAEAVGILTLSPREAAMIAGDFATKAASVQIGFVDRFTGALVIPVSYTHLRRNRAAKEARGREAIRAFSALFRGIAQNHSWYCAQGPQG